MKKKNRATFVDVDRKKTLCGQPVVSAWTDGVMLSSGPAGGLDLSCDNLPPYAAFVMEPGKSYRITVEETDDKPPSMG